MLLAAGLGERMRPLTDHTPKPLLPVAGTPLLEHHIRRLAAAGYTDLVINVSHLGQQIIDYCGDGARWGVRIRYSKEDVPLETAGGIIRALPLLGDTPFALVNSDIWTDFPFRSLAQVRLAGEAAAHLVLVGNPPWHPAGDFSLRADGLLQDAGPASSLTYAGIGVYAPGFFAGISQEKYPLRPLLDRAMARDQLSGEHFSGDWVDVGTPQRLQQLERRVGGLQGSNRIG
jgi:MurNAc alpha-1-phosphate uridylyltransferase